MLSSRTRRPDRAVYVPRAKRSQTTPPASTSDNKTQSKSLKKKSDKIKSKSIDEHSTSNSDDTSDVSGILIHPILNGAKTCDGLKNTVAESAHFITNIHLNGELLTNDKNQKNLSNLSTMSEQPKIMTTIESAGGIQNPTADKVDKEEKELIKASQEINRSNRKLIKQTFNSNVLEIDAAGGSIEEKTEEDKTVHQEEDDWDTL